MHSNVIRARVIWKSSVKTYDNDQHKFCYCDVMDDSGCIRIKGFDQLCDRLLVCASVGQVEPIFLVCCRLFIGNL